MFPDDPQKVRHCEDIETNVPCCSSCHVDNEDFDYDLPEVVKDDVLWIVCCAVATHLVED